MGADLNALLYYSAHTSHNGKENPIPTLPRNWIRITSHVVVFLSLLVPTPQSRYLSLRVSNPETAWIPQIKFKGQALGTAKNTSKTTAFVPCCTLMTGCFHGIFIAFLFYTHSIHTCIFYPSWLEIYLLQMLYRFWGVLFYLFFLFNYTGLGFVLVFFLRNLCCFGMIEKYLLLPEMPLPYYDGAVQSRDTQQ